MLAADSFARHGGNEAPFRDSRIALPRAYNWLFTLLYRQKYILERVTKFRQL